ncbi:MAG: hypothetical protein GKR99_07045 [Rhodobacteraceae bacterium]|nr:hypothetical protein [Paracoccaceae bacterium]
MNILILGASYGSLLSTKFLMAGHDATLVCQRPGAALINAEGTVLRLALRGEDSPRLIRSTGQPGKLRAMVPGDVTPAEYDLVCLAMAEPQYSAPEVKALMARIARAGKPVLSVMNMPPPPYLARIDGLPPAALHGCYTDISVWDGFDPGLMSLCSPDPQAFRPPDEKPNLVHVGLPTNFKAAPFADPAHTALLRQLEAEIDAVTLDGKDVPVKLRLNASIFVPLAKWSMVMTGNYRCVTDGAARPIREAVHDNLDQSARIYGWVEALVRDLGASPDDQVPFDKYARAAESLLKPSSVARAIDAGVARIERVDRLVQAVAATRGMQNDAVDAIVARVDARLADNQGERRVG